MDIKTRTRGNVVIEDIEIGDIHYEYEYGFCLQSEVMTKPEKNKDGNWEWQSKVIGGDRIIDYLVNPEYLLYSVKLYDYEVYPDAKKLN